MIEIRYGSIRSMDVSNGEGVGVALFVQGCHFHCYNCFNSETWDFNGGKEWTPEIEDKLMELASKPYIKRLSILGGEPLADENLDGVLNLVSRFRLLFLNKSIWIYSRYSWSDIWCSEAALQADYALDCYNNISINHKKRQNIISQCDVMIDGRYIDSQRDSTLKWRGSENQRVINVKQSLQQNKIVLYCD